MIEEIEATQSIDGSGWEQIRNNHEWLHRPSGSWVMYDRSGEQWLGISRVGGVTVGSVESETPEAAIAAVEGILSRTQRRVRS